MQINPAALKAIREHSGLTQTALAAASSVNQGNISKMEKGADGRPVSVRPATAKALAAALRVPLAAITLPPPPDEIEGAA